MRRSAALLLLTAGPAGCAAFVDWGTLTDHHGEADASATTDAPSRGDVTVADASTVDAGEDAAGPDPCSSVIGCTLCNGYYCGGQTQQNGFAGGKAGTLYLCVDGSTASTLGCNPDCIVSHATYADCCDHCTGFADGTYCGSTLGYSNGYNGAFNELRSVIFTCAGGVSAAAEQPCAPQGCTQQSTTSAVCTDD